MKKLLGSALFALSISLASCGGDGDDTLGDQAADSMDARADNLEDAADNLSGAQEDRLEDQAEATREQGYETEAAIDDSDVDADSLTEGQRNALAEGQ